MWFGLSGGALANAGEGGVCNGCRPPVLGPWSRKGVLRILVD